MDKPLISLRNVEMRFDRKTVLQDVNIDVARGEFLAVSGPNGGGKSTLLRIMLKLIKPTSGSVVYNIPPDSPCNHLHVGYLPQKSNIDTRFPITVRDTVLSGLQHGFLGRLPKGWHEDYSWVMALCGLEDLQQQTVGTLSGGQLQRTLLARAIVSHPGVLMLDEPLSYIDKRFETRLYDILAELARTTTVVLVSHEMSGIESLATRRIWVNRTVEYQYEEYQ